MGSQNDQQKTHKGTARGVKNGGKFGFFIGVERKGY